MTQPTGTAIRQALSDQLSLTSKDVSVRSSRGGGANVHVHEIGNAEFFEWQDWADDLSNEWTLLTPEMAHNLTEKPVTMEGYGMRVYTLGGFCWEASPRHTSITVTSPFCRLSEVLNLAERNQNAA